MIKEISKITEKNKPKKSISSIKEVKTLNNKYNNIKTNLLSNYFMKINNETKKIDNKKKKNNGNPKKMIVKRKTMGYLRDINNKINITYNFNAPKNKNPGNNNSDKYYLSLINNSSSNIFNSTNETSLNLNTNNYNICKKSIPTKKKLNIKINNNNKLSYYKRNNTFSKIKISNNKKQKDYAKKLAKTPLKEKKLNIKTKTKTNNEIPNLIISINKIKTNYFLPLRNEFKIKSSNSYNIKNKIKKLKNNMIETNKELDNIYHNRSFVNLNLNKNLSIIWLEKTKSLNNINDINKIRKDILQIRKEMHKTKEETTIFKEKYKQILDEIKRSEIIIKEKNKEIQDFSETKKKVNSMIILLHRRIINIKERIKKMDLKRNNLNKIWYELSLKYNKYFINK